MSINRSQRITAVVNQYIGVGVLPPDPADPGACYSTLDACGSTRRVYSSSACAVDNRLVPDKMSIQCTELQSDICNLQIEDGPRSESKWNPQTLPTQLVVDCTWEATDFAQCCTSGGLEDLNKSCLLPTDGPPTSFLDQETTYHRIQDYLDRFGRGGNAAENIQNLNDNVLSWVCFLPSQECRHDTVGITSGSGDVETDPQAGLPLTQPMAMCSMVNSSTPLGSLCYDYYRSNYNSEMEWRINTFCSSYGVKDGQPVYPQPDSKDNSIWDSGDYAQDCLCSQRWGIPTYQQVRKATGVVYEDGCWFRPCVPDSNQLKPEQGMFDPTCPTTICNNIVNSIVNVEDSENIVVNWDMNAYINCNTGSTTNMVASEAAAQEVKSSITIFLIFASVAFVIMAIIIVVAIF